MGVVGIGHWFERLHTGMVNTNELVLLKVASASGVGKKRDILAKLGVDESNYYQVDASRPIPEGFFDGIDIVHISDPNEFHKAQTMQALAKGKIVITEKAFGVNAEEFETVVNYIKANRMEGKAYLHLHYAHKLLTMQLPELLKRFTREHGKIASTSSTLFEGEHPDVQKRRLWLFAPKNGGVFMDLIHPFETYYKGALANRLDLLDTEQYMVNPDYDRINPTGVYGRVGIGGTYFADGAEAHIRVAIGIKGIKEDKVVQFVFGDGYVLRLSFVNSEVEYTTQDRGSWSLLDGAGEVIESDSPKGPTASDVLVNDILDLCRGRNNGFTMEDLRIIFGAQWQYQEMIRSKRLVSDEKRVKEFIDAGVKME